MPIHNASITRQPVARLPHRSKNVVLLLHHYPLVRAPYGADRIRRIVGMALVENCQNHNTMLRWVLIFAVVAIIAGIFGFTGISEGAAEIAKIIFYIFLVLIVVSLIFGGMIWKKVS